ncbi:MAG: AAA family ATPase [Deltaproteobacteria bacterium]|nr:AAA family ATPase [Deltaproteobacteria bacterium]
MPEKKPPENGIVQNSVLTCPRCRTTNLYHRKFCSQCSTRLTIYCPKCGRENFADDNYCGRCGGRLKPPNALPQTLLKPDGERKHVTVIFSDLSGYTAMSARLDPEEVKDIMSRIFGEIARIVAGYEGFIERFLGDAVMVLFGVPKILEDAAVRAIRTSMEIHDAVKRMSPGLEKKVGQPLFMHTGINTGLVVTGDTAGETGTHGVTGDTINLASRLKDLAKPDQILVGRETYLQAEGFFSFEALEPMRVKGLRQPIDLYRVLSPRPKWTRFEVGAERGLTPFVGRALEMGLLLQCFSRAKSGLGQALTITADAGLGKSRLLYEFRRAVAAEPATFLHGRCLSYSKNVPYFPLIDVLKSCFDIADGDGTEKIRRKVDSVLEEYPAEKTHMLPFLLELLSVQPIESPQVSMSREFKKERIIDALKWVLFNAAEIRPLVLAIEDLHWMDVSSEEALKHLLTGISGVRVFLIFTYRPHFSPNWNGTPIHSTLSLNRLSGNNSLAMVRHVLEAEEIDEPLQKLVLDKTDGVPFFVEEFTRSLKELKLIEKQGKRCRLAGDAGDMAIPSTIQDVIMARVDALPESPKKLLQTASVIDREFSFQLIRLVTQIDDQELPARLHRLRDSDLLLERGLFREPTYIFKHALTREVVYESILKKRRRRLHDQVGGAIERLYGETITEHYGVLAEHFLQSENHEKAAEYLRLAYEKAADSASLSSAMVLAKKRIACLEEMPQTEDVLKRTIDARTSLSLYLFLMGYPTEAKDSVAPVLAKATEIGYKERLSQIFTVIGYYHYMVQEDIPAALDYLERALLYSEETGDIISAIFAHYLLGLALSWNCEFEKAAFYVEKALKINLDFNISWSASLMKSTLSLYVYCCQGRIELGCRTSAEALELAEETGDIFSKATAHISHGVSLFYQGAMARARNHLIQGVDFSTRIDLQSFSALGHQWLGQMYFETGDYERSRKHYLEAIRLREDGRLFPSSVLFNRTALARTEICGPGADIDPDTLYGYVRENRIRLHDGPIARYTAEILLKMGDHVEEAVGWARRALDADRTHGMRWDLALDYRLLAEALQETGAREEAEESLARAREIFSECGADGWTGRIDD